MIARHTQLHRIAKGVIRNVAIEEVLVHGSKRFLKLGRRLTTSSAKASIMQIIPYYIMVARVVSLWGTRGSLVESYQTGKFIRSWSCGRFFDVFLSYKLALLYSSISERTKIYMHIYRGSDKKAAEQRLCVDSVLFVVCLFRLLVRLLQNDG